MLTNRQKYEYQGKTVYEWQESIDAVTVFIILPPILVNKQLRQQVKKQNPTTTLPIISVDITNNRLTVGIKGNPPYLSHETKGPVDTSQSVWFVEGDTLEVNLQKAYKGQSWMGAFKGHELSNPMEVEKINKSLLLERFQEENPGFDFSSAEINGRVPEARTFMGGIRHQ